MEKSANKRTRTLTIRDVHLAEIYFPLIVNRLLERKTITFGDLIDLSKQQHPNDEIVQNAIPVSTGRRLEVIRLITEPLGLPDITCWVVNALQENSEVYMEDFDPNKERQATTEVNWFEEFPESILPTSEIRKKAIEHQATISRKKAIGMLAEIPADNFQKIKIPKNREKADFLGDFRKPIIQDIMDGISPNEAFWNALIDFKLDDGNFKGDNL